MAHVDEGFTSDSLSQDNSSGGTCSFSTTGLPTAHPQWLASHVFKPNANISELANGEWAGTLVSLSRKDISWYHNKLNIEEIIVNCNSFPNVPLIGSKSCISYNPMLSMRHFGYPMLGKPDDEEFEGMVLHDMEAKDLALLHKIM
ncbi:hypothetical protein KIW84_051481 [Lathyrus oleraceus]|uniref:DUF7745 domain-containing protein n=1 Tax=Pisum sativum TaxID=3888 RepID=A0A9D4WK86_PEA|nr:hypothetical protein KIW84_051481 [Pisum sativum]